MFNPRLLGNGESIKTEEKSELICEEKEGLRPHISIVGDELKLGSRRKRLSLLRADWGLN